MLGIGTSWEAEDLDWEGLRKSLCLWGTARACVGLSFWKMGDFRMANNRHHHVLGCRHRPDLMFVPRRLSHAFLLS